MVKSAGFRHTHEPAPQPDILLYQCSCVICFSYQPATKIVMINRHRSADGLNGALPHAVDYIIGLLRAVYHGPDQALALAIGQGNVSMSCYITVCIMGECLWILAGYGRNLIGACVVGCRCRLIRPGSLSAGYPPHHKYRSRCRSCLLPR